MVVDKRKNGGKQRRKKMPDFTQKDRGRMDKRKKTIMLKKISGINNLYSIIPSNLLE